VYKKRKMENLIYIDKLVDEDLIDRLVKEVEWIDETKMRRECFMADFDVEYTYLDYSGAPTYKAKPLHPIVNSILEKVNDKLGTSLDICFLNLYMESRNGLGWHADDSHSIDHNEGIAVVSFGAEREIWWKVKGEKGLVPEENRKLLENGSLFYMPPGFQDTHLHRIPKHDRECGPRVSLTFRKYKAAN
jgi:alkylated DNA repair dioxygenase AlkB